LPVNLLASDERNARPLRLSIVATNHRTAMATLALATVALAGCAGTALGTPVEAAPAASAPSAPATGWTKVAPWPYAAWYNALTAWTGSEVLILGGAVDRGPGASGPAPDIPVGHAAGAYSPATNTWRAIARPPFSLYEATVVAAGEHAYALAFDAGFEGSLTKTHLWEYGVTSNRWRELAAPPGFANRLTVAGDTLAAWTSFPGKDSPAVEFYDLAKGTWHTAPANPWRGYAGREIVGLPDGRVVTFEAPADPQNKAYEPGARAPMWRAAVLDAGGEAWRKLPPSGIAVGSWNGYLAPAWAFVGGRVVNADPRTLPAAKVAGKHVGPVPTGGILDVNAGRWEKLPTLPGQPHEHRSAPKGQPQPELGWTTRDYLRAAGGDYALAFGWAYNARTGTWTEMTPIPGDKDGLAYDTAIWAGDRLLFWANAKVKPVEHRTGYWIRPTHVGWSWRPS
jgi:hypothetical protein